ncbi:hypothetical protein QIT55_gp18 [Nitrosopumilus spindle-shaped virus]|uniref:Uncharacterized protein n=1 Tax=Nitrosopumilus spindle-shaped virus 1 TaxID=2848002 RepID=A0A514K306_9VIRU|nr:hypothetical protein QIT55_gp18 [Nitrosopumilus spindle-shaped virus]QDI74004.1 hypothetical protein [Nitrosopumilus spindle-shaped virus]
MDKQKVIIYQGRTSPFSPTCVEIMDYFLSYPDLYHTAMTVSLYLEKSSDSVKNCMSLLLKNSYLTKKLDSGHVYFITKENMEFWAIDFKNHILNQHEIEKAKFS